MNRWTLRNLYPKMSNSRIGENVVKCLTLIKNVVKEVETVKRLHFWTILTGFTIFYCKISKIMMNMIKSWKFVGFNKNNFYIFNKIR